MHKITVLAGQRLGITESDDGIWRLSFMPYDLGYFDLDRGHCRPSTTRSASMEKQNPVLKMMTVLF
ncbi:hypothetical protein [Mesorhizobium sp.]|uniref:hypothetical protein n=1 Tax=Mesorhizobium sp. TaxID=1871066 RepID=UPI00257CF7C5|nr:hypothetical protein [Mesorhizobium sp.]